MTVFTQQYLPTRAFEVPRLARFLFPLCAAPLEPRTGDILAVQKIYRYTGDDFEAVGTSQIAICDDLGSASVSPWHHFIGTGLWNKAQKFPLENRALDIANALTALTYFGCPSLKELLRSRHLASGRIRSDFSILVARGYAYVQRVDPDQKEKMKASAQNLSDAEIQAELDADTLVLFSRRASGQEQVHLAQLATRLGRLCYKKTRPGTREEIIPVLRLAPLATPS